MINGMDKAFSFMLMVTKCKSLSRVLQDELQGPLVAGVPTLISVSAGVEDREALVHEIDEELCDGNVLYVIDRVLF